VMIRETLSAGSAHASMLVTAGQSALFESRTATGATTTAITASAPSGPVWLRVQRTGKKFTASVSADGTAWTVIGTANITMSQNVHIGLAVSSHVDGSLSTATLDDVTAVP
jgi:regulation of enolase protein 1 (concanavalin A-like superfamily)